MKDARTLPDQLGPIADQLDMREEHDGAATIRLAATAITTLLEDLDNTRRHHRAALTSAHTLHQVIDDRDRQLIALNGTITSQRQRIHELTTTWADLRDQLAKARAHAATDTCPTCIDRATSIDITDEMQALRNEVIRLRHDDELNEDLREIAASLRHQNDTLRQELAIARLASTVNATHIAQQPIVAAALDWRDAPTPASEIATLRQLHDAVDTYRARTDGTTA